MPRGGRRRIKRTTAQLKRVAPPLRALHMGEHTVQLRRRRSQGINRVRRDGCRGFAPGHDCRQQGRQDNAPQVARLSLGGRAVGKKFPNRRKLGALSRRIGLGLRRLPRRQAPQRGLHARPEIRGLRNHGKPAPEPTSRALRGDTLLARSADIVGFMARPRGPQKCAITQARHRARRVGGSTSGFRELQLTHGTAAHLREFPSQITMKFHASAGGAARGAHLYSRG